MADMLRQQPVILPVMESGRPRRAQQQQQQQQQQHAGWLAAALCARVLPVCRPAVGPGRLSALAGEALAREQPAPVCVVLVVVV